MKPLRARVIKFSVGGFGRIFGGDFDAPGAPAALVSDGEQLSNLNDGVAPSCDLGNPWAPVRPAHNGFRFAAWRVVWLCQ